MYVFHIIECFILCMCFIYFIGRFSNSEFRVRLNELIVKSVTEWLAEFINREFIESFTEFMETYNRVVAILERFKILFY